MNKPQLLTVLVVLWLAILGYRLVTHEPQKTAPLTYTKGSTASVAVAKVGDPKLRVRLDLLNSSGQSSVGTPRNIFAPVQVYHPPPPLPPPPSKSALPEPPPLPPPPSPEELAAQSARTELAQYKYLGYINRGGKDFVFLARGNELFDAVGRGGTLAGGIVIKEITPSSVILLEPQTRIEATVALSGT